MSIDIKEIGETLNMVAQQNLDVRTITMGINTMCCADEDIDVMARKVYNRMTTAADRLVSVAEALEREYGIPIVNKRISVTPMAMIAAATKARDLTPLAKAMDSAAEAVGVDFVGGFSAMVQKGIGDADARLMDSIPSALASTSRVCSSLNVASVRAGINMDAVLRAAQVVKDAAQATVDINCYGAAKLVDLLEHGRRLPLHGRRGARARRGRRGHQRGRLGSRRHGVGHSQPPVDRRLPDRGRDHQSHRVRRSTRVGELMAREASRRLGVKMGIVDLSLAPTPAVGDSVAEVLEAIGVGTCGGPGTTAALAMLNDAVKKGGVMASSSVGGLSGAFIPVSEDAGMIRAVEAGALSLEKLEAMTCVCSVGLDMVAVPGDTSVEALAGFIADEMAIGVINNKTTAVRVDPRHRQDRGRAARVRRPVRQRSRPGAQLPCRLRLRTPRRPGPRHRSTPSRTSRQTEGPRSARSLQPTAAPGLFFGRRTLGASPLPAVCNQRVPGHPVK